MRKLLQSVFLTICVFSIGTWIGAIWRESFIVLNSVKIFQQDNAHENRAILQRDKSSYDFSHFTKDCLPQRNIYFLKTHKTAGSTVQNILLRHAERVKSFVGLSATSDARFKYVEGDSFQRSFVRPTNQTVNMLCHHMRFDRQEVAAVLPNNSVYITILREPADVFESYFDYLHYDCTAFGYVPQSTYGLRQWLLSPQKYFHGPEPGSLWWFAKNAMFYDLGFDSSTDDDQVITHAINEMRNTYDLVLITDYLDESLILLKELLCVDFRDLAHLQLNSRSKSNIQLDEVMREQIKKWNKADAMIYRAFNETFWEKVDEFGKEKMQREVHKLRTLSDELQAHCIDGKGVITKLVKNPQNRVYNPEGVQMLGYNLNESSKNNKTCQDVVKPERIWFQYLLERQYGKIG